MRNPLKLIISLALPLAVGGISGFLTRAEIGGWFQTIQKPAWQPPNWLFGPVWTALYLLMGIAFYFIWKADVPPAKKKTAMALWAVQLVLNFFWSLIFFNQHNIGLALAEIIALWIAIILTIFAFARMNRLAAWLLVPYISWVSFAALLNLAIFTLNR